MKLKRFLIVYLGLLYMDLIFHLNTYDMYLRGTIFNILLFDLVNASLITLITSIFKEKANKIISYVLAIFMWFWYSLFYIFYNVFITPFSIALFRQSDQTLAFGKNIIMSILESFHLIILFLVPLILLVVFRKKIKLDRESIKQNAFYGWIFVIGILIFTGNVLLQGKGIGSTYNLMFETNNVSLNIERLGVMGATYLDVKRTIFGFEEKIMDTDMDMSTLEDDTDMFDYDSNILELDFSGGIGTIGKINNFMKNEDGTKKNKYTGMFEGMNLIFVVAESFSEIAVSEELTPTLYKMVHEGFYFKNFYTSNNLSTIGGEFQALTGLYADNSVLSSWRGGKATYPYGLGNVFKELGYKTYAYHNNSAYYQDRNVYLKSQGLNNYKGCYNGLEKIIDCNKWPQSDVEMINGTVKDYIENEELFMTYYMTVSGHFYYDRNSNAMASKNYKYVKDLEYNEQIKGYLATQIELDKAMESLLKHLEENGKLDNTAIVLLADHFPYNLSIANINTLSDYKRDSLIEANSNNLIIYNHKMKSVNVDKVGMSIDVLPTVLNLFGVEYDSRLIMGKDILSSSPGIAIFKDKSWVTDKGTYRASTGKLSGDSDVSQEYIDTINKIVNNRVAMSRMIVESNYYKYIMNK